MQAIARVNRVFRDKEGGLVVDYIGIAYALRKAMRDYTGRDQKNYGDMDIGKAALPKFREKLAVCRDLLHGFVYSGVYSGSGLERARIISGAVNFILEKSLEDERKGKDKDKISRNVFIKEGLPLKQALSMCASLASDHDMLEAAFMEAVRATLAKLAFGGEGKKIHFAGN